MIEHVKSCLHRNKSIIAVSGKSGCGNTTLSTLIANTLNLKLVNYTFRALAAERGQSLEDIMSEAAVNDEIDRLIDRRQREMAEETGSVLASRLAIWLKKDACLKVYLHADLSVRIDRIRKREGWSEEYALAHTEKRDREDRERYLKTYKIDNNQYQFADIIFDTGLHTPQQLLESVLNELQKYCQ